MTAVYRFATAAAGAPNAVRCQLGALLTGREKVHLNEIFEDRCTFRLMCDGASGIILADKKVGMPMKKSV